MGIAFTVRIIPTKNPPNKPVGGINISSAYKCFSNSKKIFIN